MGGGPLGSQVGEGGPVTPGRSPWRIFWHHFRRSTLALTGGGILILLYLGAIFAAFLAPYSQERQNRDLFFQPPTAIHLRDPEGNFHWPPFVYGSRLVDPDWTRYAVDPSRRFPLRLLVRGDPYTILGAIRSDWHLLGVEEPGRLFLLGSDQFGRDVLSRLLYGSQISLSVGIVGIAITFFLGLLLGGVSGYFGGIVDTILMRFTELLMSIPALYLILALRATIPPTIPSTHMYLIIVMILAFVGWASLARIIRGMVLSLKGNEYVTAARALGMGTMRIIARHILPNTLSFVIVAATVSVPGYILGEVALSFLGFGIQEPQSSWGIMLQQAQSVRVMTSFPWMLAPGVLIFITVLAFNFLGDGLRDALDPKRLL